MRRAGTTAQLAVLVFLFQMIAATALLAGLGAYVRWEIAAQANDTAELLREDLLSVYARDGLPALARTIRERSTRRITPGTVVLLADADLVPVAGTLTAWPRAVTAHGHTVVTTLYRRDHGAPEAMRVRATTLPDGAHLLTGVIVQGEASALRVLEDASMMALALAALLSLATAAVSARLFSRRLSPPIAALEAAGRGNLALRVEDRGEGDAFATLGRVVNAALDRIGTLVAELKLATDAMAHDLKSPITRLRAALDRAERALDDDPAVARAAIARAGDEAGRLLSITETALRISRAEAGIGREDFQPVDLSAMLEDMAEIYGPSVEAAGRTIAVEVPDRIAPVRIHRELLGQAVSNLIDNTMKYGAGAIRLMLVRDAAGAVGIGVDDEGEGIAPEHRELACRKFGRVDAARSGDGAGLGLSLVAAVAHLHGGGLTMRARDGGFTVSLTIPAA